MDRKLNLNAVDYAKSGLLLFDTEITTNRSEALANYTYTTSARKVSERFVKELAAAHDKCEAYGKYDEKDSFIAEYSEAISDIQEELGDYNEGEVSILCVMEQNGEPDEDFIVIYNYEGVLRMTGIHGDSHCACYIYKINQI